MRVAFLITLLIIISTTILGCGTSTETVDARPVVAAANSYLEAAIGDLMGDADDAVEILPLAGPGTCPGHFDLRPSQIERLAQCRLLVRFDFQKRLEDKLAVRVGDSLHVVAVVVTEGMCLPSSYNETCRQIAEALVEAGCLDRAVADARLVAIAVRMKGLSDWSREQIVAAGLDGLPVITSAHQESFCQWLGLRVAATYNGGETRPSRIDAAVSDAQAGGVKLLIANRPEGRRTADMLAERLGIEAVVFDNFPRPGAAAAFDELVRGNVAELGNGPR
jgi:zinc transport system substrate-binding protein